MLSNHRSLAVAALMLLASTALLRGQTVVEPVGHWEGVIEAPGMNVPFEMDLVRNDKGELGGSLGIPGEHLKGLPLASVAVEGTAITFQARTDQPFRGVLSDDGRSIEGDVTIEGFVVPVTMKRTGEARFEPTPKSAPVNKELEGEWTGTPGAGAPFRLVLTMRNEQDGSATARIVNLDEGGLTIPAHTVTQAGRSITLDLDAIGGSYAGTLNDAGTELSGTFRQGTVSLPVTFRRSQPDAAAPAPAR